MDTKRRNIWLLKNTFNFKILNVDTEDTERIDG